MSEPKKKEPKECTHAFVLKLTDDKWAVGRSNEPYKSIVRCFEGKGTLWTRKHPPVEIDLVCKGDSHIVKYLLATYIKKYGVANVRGYCFSVVEPSDAQIKGYLEYADKYASIYD